MLDPLPFQRRFLAKAFAPGIRTACLSLPRGNGKSTLSGHLVARALTPGDPLFVRGSELVLLAGSIEQCRVVFRVVRSILEPTGQYRFLDSATRCGITHAATNTRLRVHGSNARTAFGLVGVPLVIWDEPGAAEVNAGQVLWDAVRTSQGKPGSPLRAMLIGTLAPAVSGWWHDLVQAGSAGPVHVTALQGRADRWDQWPEIRRCNPLMAKFPESREALLDERDEARRDSRLKAAFMSYRLNVPTADESEVLLTVDDWKRTCARPEALPGGLPVVGVDLGGGRAWSAATAIWESGRVESLACAPGIPGLQDQEKRDRVPANTYRKLAETGRLRVGNRLAGPATRPAGDDDCRSMGPARRRDLRPVPVERAARRRAGVEHPAAPDPVERG